MNIFANFFTTSKTAYETMKAKTNLERIINAIEHANKSNKHCISVAVSTKKFQLPFEVDFRIENDIFSNVECRIEYTHHLMVQLEKLGYYAACREETNTVESFSLLFVMVQ